MKKNFKRSCRTPGGPVLVHIKTGPSGGLLDLLRFLKGPFLYNEITNEFLFNFRKKRRKNFKRSSRPLEGPVLVRTVMYLHLTNALLTASRLNQQPQWSSTEGKNIEKITKGNRFGCRNVTRFRIFQVKELKFSAYA